MREAYIFPKPEEPIAEVNRAIELDDFREERRKKKKIKENEREPKARISETTRD